jgi:hypothetical protein
MNMTSVDLDSIVNTYLADLDSALGDLPASDRRQIIESITSHIDEARASNGSQSEAALREILDQLGDPSEIAAAAQGDVIGEQTRGSRRLTSPVAWAVAVVAVIVIVVLSLLFAGTFSTQAARYGQIPNILGATYQRAEVEIKAAGFKPWLVCQPKQNDQIPGNRVVMLEGFLGESYPLGAYVNFKVALSPTGCHANFHTVPKRTPIPY